MITYNWKNECICEAPYKSTCVSLGASDMASLLIRSGSQVELLSFGEDAAYKAWYVEDKNIEIPKHYQLKIVTNNWLKIYDDYELVFDEIGDFEIYRAGELGCLIRKIK